MDWINVNEKYLDYLRTYENHIPYTDYGSDKYKPFFGILFETEEFYYITQVSHAQDRHKEMKNLLTKQFVCDCGYKNDRDANASLNIKKEGLRLLTV